MSVSRVLGVDCGTFFYQVAEKKDKLIDIKTIRNAFVELKQSEDIEEVLKQNDWQYIKDDNSYFVIGEDSMRVARIFPKVDLRRPMQDGILNKEEDKKMLVMAQMIKSSIGKAPDKNSVVCTCVSSDPVDNAADNTFHRARLEGMFKRLGWSVKIIEEGHAVILSERPVLVEKDGSKSPYSGIGISFGAGKVNCVLAYKGLPIIGLSATRSGDWIDQKVSEQTGVPIAQVINIKENKLDFNKIDYENDVIFGLDTYYTVMIKYAFENFAVKFATVKSQFEAPLDIVLAGGTSLPKGFKNKVSKVVSGLNLPFNIKEIKLAKDPRNTVVTGLLTQALITHKKLSEKKETDEIGEMLD